MLPPRTPRIQTPRFLHCAADRLNRRGAVDADRQTGRRGSAGDVELRRSKDGGRGSRSAAGTATTTGGRRQHPELGGRRVGSEGDECWGRDKGDGGSERGKGDEGGERGEGR